jgi:nucleoside-diphosphate-sugar epimerase
MKIGGCSTALPPYRHLCNAFAPRSPAQTSRRVRDRGRGLARILVTGAAGFIGRALCRGLAERGHTVLGRTRRPADPIPGVELRPIGDIGPQTDWRGHLDGVDIVIHLANRAHRPADRELGKNEAAAAAALARAGAACGVRRLVHMSSVRAMGDATAPESPFRCTDPAVPRGEYGRGKLAIERALVTVAQQTRLELVILRPPLVYGPGVRANFRALIRLAASGLPLPFAGIENRRSLIFLDNLVDIVSRACMHPGATGRVLLARDSVDLSTPELIRVLAEGLGCAARLFSVPAAAFAPLRRLPAFGPLVRPLTLSLQVDDSETRAALAWLPPVATDIGLAATVSAFRAGR